MQLILKFVLIIFLSFDIMLKQTKSNYNWKMFILPLGLTGDLGIKNCN